MLAGRNKFQYMFILDFPQACMKNQEIWQLEINCKKFDGGVLDLALLGFWTFPLFDVQKYVFFLQQDTT
jgi:hypothetical protein